ncbi:KTSC domain-containing protein [Longimicrobium sp.]|uniref:KTSC domain-containing protein n=1 Tax=Longimicrobium sp. TaxID=2029185 RepID=UPI002F924367
MKRQRLDSSSLASAGYDPGRQVLEVEFLNGGVYEYDDVPEETYRALLDADSKGRFLNAEIKPHHPSRRLQAAPRG